MTEFEFLVEYHCKAWVTIDAETSQEAQDKLTQDSIKIDDYTISENILESEIEIIKCRCSE